MNEGIVRTPRFPRTLSPLLSVGLLLTAACDEQTNRLEPGYDLRSGSNATSIIDVAASDTETWAVIDDGQVKGWGQVFCDANGCPAPADIDPIALPGPATAVRTNGSRAAALMADGSVFGWDIDGPGALAPYSLLTGEVAVDLAMGSDFFCVRLDDDSLQCEGFGSSPVPSWLDGVTSTGPVIEIAAGPEHLCVAQDSLDVTCWDSVQPTATYSFGEPVTQLAAGEGHTCALLDSGAIHCWGDDTHGQLGHSGSGADLVPLSEPARSLTAGAQHTCAVGTDTDTLYCWGDDQEGQLGAGTNVGGFRQVDLSQQLASVVHAGPTASTTFVGIQGAGLRGFGRDSEAQRGYGSLTTPTNPIVGDLPDILVLDIPDEE